MRLIKIQSWQNAVFFNVKADGTLVIIVLSQVTQNVFKICAVYYFNN